MPFGGFALAAAVYTLVITFATDSIPAKWPLAPTHKDDDPAAFNRHIILWFAVGAIGSCVTIASLF